jgi:hypothetical protein
MPAVSRSLNAGTVKGLRQFLSQEQQCAWLEGEANPVDGDRPESDDLEQRFKYSARFEKLLHRTQAEDVLDLLKTYAATCLPIPRLTERFYWSVSCLPGSPDKPLVRISASFMELFALHADGDDLRARIILHLSDFTADGSAEPDHLDHALLDSCVDRPADLSHFFWKADTFGVKVRGAASIGKFLSHPYGLRAIRRFNLTHMNRGRNAYQASHCYSLADRILD